MAEVPDGERLEMHRLRLLGQVANEIRALGSPAFVGTRLGFLTTVL